MTKEEALSLLNNTPRSDKPSKPNPDLTTAQIIDIFRGGLVGRDDSYILPDWYEKRIYQICEIKNDQNIEKEEA